MKDTMNDGFKKIDKRFDDIDQEFKLLNERLDRMIVKKEQDNKEITQLLQDIIKNTNRP